MDAEWRDSRLRPNRATDVPNVVETCCLDCNEIILRYPRFPVILEDTQGMIRVLQLAEGILVYNIRVVGILEYAWSNPGLRVVTKLSFVFATAELTSTTNQPPLRSIGTAHVHPKGI